MQKDAYPFSLGAVCANWNVYETIWFSTKNIPREININITK